MATARSQLKLAIVELAARHFLGERVTTFSSGSERGT